MSEEVVRGDSAANSANSPDAKKQNGMIGAIVGDIAGSRFEFHNRKAKDFTLLVSRAEAPVRPRPKNVDKPRGLDEALLARGAVYSSTLKDNAVQEFGRIYPHAGYGGHSHSWLLDDDPQPTTAGATAQ